jgi:hypothetical protein
VEEEEDDGKASPALGWAKHKQTNPDQFRKGPCFLKICLPFRILPDPDSLPDLLTTSLEHLLINVSYSYCF